MAKPQKRRKGEEERGRNVPFPHCGLLPKRKIKSVI